MLPPPEVDVAQLFRDERAFAAVVEAFGEVMDPELEAVAPWGSYSGLDGFRAMWLDWLEPWERYQVRVDEVIERGDSLVVLVRDRGRRRDTDAEVELISGSVWRFRDGKLVAVRFYSNREELEEDL